MRGIGMYFSEAKALDKLEQCVIEYPSIEEMAILYAKKPEWAQGFADRITAVFPQNANISCPAEWCHRRARRPPSHGRCLYGGRGSIVLNSAH